MEKTFRRSILDVLIVCLCLASSTGPASSQEIYKFELKWPSLSHWQFTLPSGVAVDSSGGVIGIVGGVVTGESPEKIEHTQFTLNEVINGIKVRETVRDHFTNLLQEKFPEPLVLIKDMGPTAPDEKVDYRPLRERGIDTVIELRALKVGLWNADLWHEEVSGRGKEPKSFGEMINPLLTFFMTVNMKLIRLEDGKELYDRTFLVESDPRDPRESRKFVEWAVNNGEPLREAFDQCNKIITWRMMEELLYQFLLPSQESS